MLAADLRVRSNEPLNPGYLLEAERLGLATAEVVSFPTSRGASEGGFVTSPY